MSGCFNIFFAYKPSSGQGKVGVVDGTFSSISGKGTIHATPSVSLSSVLHVPNFSNNLLSINLITHDF